MRWVKGSDRNFKASQTERQRKTKKDRREGRETSGGDPKIRVRWRGSSTGAPGSGPRIAFAKNLRGQGSRLSTGQAEGCPHAPEEAAPSPTVGFRVISRPDHHKLRSLRFPSPRLCRIAVFFIQTNVSLYSPSPPWSCFVHRRPVCQRGCSVPGQRIILLLLRRNGGAQ